MAELTKPNFTLVLEEPANKVTVKVTGRINFSLWDVFQLNNGVTFKLKCTIVGKDSPGFPWYDDDNDLFSLPSKIYPDASVTAAESYTFTKSHVPFSALNEDNFGDELYARVTLVNQEDGKEKSKKSNVIDADFG